MSVDEAIDALPFGPLQLLVRAGCRSDRFALLKVTTLLATVQ